MTHIIKSNSSSKMPLKKRSKSLRRETEADKPKKLAAKIRLSLKDERS
jgi:hypothetical protein